MWLPGSTAGHLPADTHARRLAKLYNDWLLNAGITVPDTTRARAGAQARARRPPLGAHKPSSPRRLIAPAGILADCPRLIVPACLPPAGWLIAPPDCSRLIAPA